MCLMMTAVTNFLYQLLSVWVGNKSNFYDYKDYDTAEISLAYTISE